MTALAAAHRFFHRDPDRVIKPRANSVLSAADGVVSSIKQIDFLNLLNQPGIQDLDKNMAKLNWNDHDGFWVISVFMSVLDVHVNRSPVSGTVLMKVHKPGAFIPLGPELKEEHNQNERNTIVIKNDDMTVAVVQMAGHLARKIECWVDPGNILRQGDRIGWIRMGSRVDVVFPALEEFVIEVQEGLSVKAGIDSLATMNESGNRLVGSVHSFASTGGNDTGKKLLIKPLIWTLYSYLYGKMALSGFINRISKRREHLEHSGGT